LNNLLSIAWKFWNPRRDCSFYPAETLSLLSQGRICGVGAPLSEAELCSYGEMLSELIKRPEK